MIVRSNLKGGNSRAWWCRLSTVLAIVSALLGSCALPTEVSPPTVGLTGETPHQTITIAFSPTAESTPEPVPRSALGMGLRRETTASLLTYKDHPGLVSCASLDLAEAHYPALEGWTRILSAPSLATLRQKAEEAQKRGIPYEALGYGLETSETTPQSEWQDLVGSTRKARALADEYGKGLVMAPGLRLMSHNRDQYPEMAALADVWILQTQRLQAEPPGAAYRQAVKEEIDSIRAGNAHIEVWAQITLPPDREPNAEEWLAYRQSILDLVDGTYIGVYTWNVFDHDLLVATIDEILTSIHSTE